MKNKKDQQRHVRETKEERKKVKCLSRVTNNEEIREKEVMK